MSFFLILLIIIGVLVLFMVGIYNGLVRGRNGVKNAWAQIDVQLKRRYDLIPNLIETVKGYAKHERETFEKIVQLRQQAVSLSSDNVADRAKAESLLSTSLKSVFALAENYPDLKANQNFLALQEELSSTENRIGFARQYYNDAVMHQNNKIQMFPSNIFAGMFGFKQEVSFEIENAAEKQVPKVSF